MNKNMSFTLNAENKNPNKMSLKSNPTETNSP